MKKDTKIKEPELKEENSSNKEEKSNISVSENSALSFFMNFTPKIPVSAYVAEVKASINK